jgi:hypothetical protein
VVRAAFTLLLALVLCAASAQAAAPADGKAAAPVAKTEPKTIDPAKRADILRLLQVTQAASMGEQAVQQILATFRQMMPQVKDEVWQEVKKEVSADELIQRLVPIYDKHFSPAELKDLLRFYESPIGKKTTQVMPAINQEALQIGQQWGSEVSLRVKRRVDALSPLPAAKK